LVDNFNELKDWKCNVLGIEPRDERVLYEMKNVFTYQHWILFSCGCYGWIENHVFLSNSTEFVPNTDTVFFYFCIFCQTKRSNH
jgi:hypothetical protein